MANLNLQKRLASKILGVGLERVKINPAHIKEIASAITKDDVRSMIKDGFITIKRRGSISRVRARARHLARKKGHQRGIGKREGSKKARSNPKERWINLIRLLRATLRELVEKKLISKKTAKEFYKKAKGGAFRSRGHMILTLNQMGLFLKKPKQGGGK